MKKIYRIEGWDSDDRKNNYNHTFYWGENPEEAQKEFDKAVFYQKLEMKSSACKNGESVTISLTTYEGKDDFYFVDDFIDEAKQIDYKETILKKVDYEIKEI